MKAAVHNVIPFSVELFYLSMAAVLSFYLYDVVWIDYQISSCKMTFIKSHVLWVQIEKSIFIFHMRFICKIFKIICNHTLHQKYGNEILLWRYFQSSRSTCLSSGVWTNFMIFSNIYSLFSLGEECKMRHTVQIELISYYIPRKFTYLMNFDFKEWIGW